MHTARSTSVFVPCWVQSVIRQIFAAASAGQEIILQFQQILKKTDSLSKVENEILSILENEDLHHAFPSFYTLFASQGEEG